MDAEELAELIQTLRRTGGEPADVEAKSRQGVFPKSVRETLVAFANTDGGVVIVGLDETAGCAAVRLPDAAQYRDNLGSLSRDEVEPPLSGRV